MRLAGVFFIAAAMMLRAPLSPAMTGSEPAFDAKPAATEMAPGLADDIAEPFFEDDAFPLQSLIALHPDAPLSTARGRCLSLHVFGADLTARCERRFAEHFADEKSVIYWFGLGQEAVGLGAIPLLDPPKNGVIRFIIGTAYRIRQGKLTSEPAMGSCRMDRFYLSCQTIGKSGRIDVEFATAGGLSTHQYPLADPFFRYKNALVYTAPGQCIRYTELERDATSYCASFIGRTLADGKVTITVFTLDGATFGLYGLTDKVMSGPNGSVITPITYVVIAQGDRTGTAPVVGSCQESPGPNGRSSVDCKVTYVREGTALEVSFETSGPWRETKPLSWQRTGGSPSTSCVACPRILPKASPPD